MKLPRLSKLQILTHIGAWIPLGVLIFDYLHNNLTVNPIKAAELRTGNITLILLVLSLACTPVNTLFRLPVVNRVRTMLGLYGYMYAVIHFSIFYGVDYAFNLRQILRDTGTKLYIIAGFTAFVLLTIIAITSFRWWMVRLGKTWKRIHRMVYIINLLVVLHFAMSVKGDFFRLQGDIARPLLAGLVVVTLLVLRIPAVRRNVAGKLQLPWLHPPGPIKKNPQSTGD